MTEFASAPVEPRLCFEEAEIDLCTPLWWCDPAPPCEGDWPGAGVTPLPDGAATAGVALEATFRRDNDEPDRLPSLSA